MRMPVLQKILNMMNDGSTPVLLDNLHYRNMRIWLPTSLSSSGHIESTTLKEFSIRTTG